MSKNRSEARTMFEHAKSTNAVPPPYRHPHYSAPTNRPNNSKGRYTLRRGAYINRFREIKEDMHSRCKGCWHANASSTGTISVAPIASTSAWLGKIRLTDVPIDTGSAINVMSTKFFNKWCANHRITKEQQQSYRIPPPTEHVRVVGGQFVKVVDGVKLEFRLSENGAKHNIDFCLLESTTVPLLFGTPALRMLKVRVTAAERPNFDFITQKYIKETVDSSDQPTGTPIVAANRCVIASNCAMTIKTKRVEPSTVATCPTTMTQFTPASHRGDIDIRPAIGTVTGKGNTIVAVMNHLREDAVIEKGDILGYSTKTTIKECERMMKKPTCNYGESLWLTPEGEQVLKPRNDMIRDSMPKRGDALTTEQSKRIEQLVYDNADVTSTGLADLPLCVGPPMDIDTGDATPIRQKGRPEPIAAEKFIDDRIKALLAHDMIVVSTADWCNTVTIVAKKAMSPRWKFHLCVDFRALNRLTIPMPINRPRLADVVRRLHHKRFISTINLQQAYWQLPLTEDASRKTTFACSKGVFRFTRMPYGLCNATAAYTALITSVLTPITRRCGLSTNNPDEYVGLLVDDVIIATTTFKGHIKLVDEVYKLLIKHRLKISLSKCRFGITETIYLGWLVSATGKTVNPERTLAIDYVAVPKTIKDVQSFLALANYYRDCLPNIATHTVPLYELCKVKCKFVWTSVHQAKFEKIKQLLKEAVLLFHPDPNKAFELYTDASEYGVGGVLEQQDINGIGRPVGFFSHQLDPAQRRYSVSEKECLAVVLSLRFWRQYIIGGPISVYTDHIALVPLFNSPSQTHRFSQWLDQVSEYQPKLYYKKGTDNVNADFFSRYPVHEPGEEICNRHGSCYLRIRLDSKQEMPMLNASESNNVTNVKRPTETLMAITPTTDNVEASTSPITNRKPVVAINHHKQLNELDAIESPSRRSSLMKTDPRNEGEGSQKSSRFWNRLKNKFTKKSTDDKSPSKARHRLDNDLPSPSHPPIGERDDSSSAIGSIEDDEVEDCYYVYTPEEYVGEIVGHEDITQAQLGDQATQELVVDLKNNPKRHPQLVMFGKTLFTIRPFGNGECVPYIPEYMRNPINQQSPPSPNDHQSAASAHRDMR